MEITIIGKLLINENEAHGSISSAYVSTISDLKMSVYNTINRNKSISDKRAWCNKSHNRKSSRKLR